MELNNESPPVVFSGEITDGEGYLLKQIHLHFGCGMKTGSEHSIDGIRYSGEVCRFLPSNNFFVRSIIFIYSKYQMWMPAVLIFEILRFRPVKPALVTCVEIIPGIA